MATARYKSDPSIVPKIAHAIRGGATRLQACMVAGVAWADLEKWIDKDRAVREAIEAAEDGRGALPMPKPEPLPRASDDGDLSEHYARVMAEARDAYGPGRLGLLRWIDARGQAMRPALHPLDPLWLEKFGEFYASHKLIMLARKGLRAGGSSSAVPALVRCALFANRRLDAGTVGVIPIMSATRDEADGRFITARAYLRAIGFTPEKGGDTEDGVRYEVASGGIPGTFIAKRSENSGGGIIAVQDRHGHRIQFRILPALVKHGIGYTAAAVFLDESDMWPNDPEHHVNPGEKILDRVRERCTTTYYAGTCVDCPRENGVPVPAKCKNAARYDHDEEDPGAEVLIFSASYNADSAHKRAVDTAMAKAADPFNLTHLTRLGQDGAHRDEDARRALAAQLGSADPRLLAPAEPASPDLPAWVFNPTQAGIAQCYGFSECDLSRMLAHYGGRAAEHSTGADHPLATVAFPARTEVPLWDVVIGVAPPERSDDPWGSVAVGWHNGSAHVLAAGMVDVRGVGAMAASHRATAMVVHGARRAIVEAHAWDAWAGGDWPAIGIVDESVYDGRTLRLGPLRALYEGGRCLHAPGLAAFEATIRGCAPAGDRCPLAEALAVAAQWLSRCYGAQGVSPLQPEGRRRQQLPRAPAGSIVVGYGSRAEPWPDGSTE